MLPVGHVAGGFIAAKIAAHFIPELNQPYYLVLASFFGFLPDLDFFAAFWKTKKLTIDELVSHRDFFSHGPLLYVLAFLLWYLLFPAYRLIAWTFILGTMSHFILDTVSESGIAWLYPFRKNRLGYAVNDRIDVKESNFFKYWIGFVKEYSKKLAFKEEIIIIIIAIIWLVNK